MTDGRPVYDVDNLSSRVGYPGLPSLDEALAVTREFDATDEWIVWSHPTAGSGATEEVLRGVGPHR